MLKRSFFVVIGSLAFSFGVLTIGYGFWTDKLDIEGQANVIFSVNVTDDVVEEKIVSPEAVEIVVNPPLDNAGKNEGDSSIQQPDTQQGDTGQPAPEQQQDPSESATEPPAEPTDTGVTPTQGETEQTPTDTEIVPTDQKDSGATTEGSGGSSEESGGTTEESGGTSEGAGATNPEGSGSGTDGTGETVTE